MISDGFWYIICLILNPKPEFEQHQEFLLDRIAANYVSFTLIEDRRFTDDHKKQFFKRFYDIISQAVYYSLYYAYPKSRKRLDDTFMKKLLLNFSNLFTGTEIHSASYNHWEDVGAASFINKRQGSRGGKDPSLADSDINKNT